MKLTPRGRCAGDPVFLLGLRRSNQEKRKVGYLLPGADRCFCRLLTLIQLSAFVLGER